MPLSKPHQPNVQVTDADVFLAVARNVQAVLRTISRAAERVGRSAGSVRLVAATKSVPVNRIREGLTAGLSLLGENRLQEALRKIEQLGRDGVSWHFIGRLQRRKAKAVVGLFDLIHSVDSLDLALEINHRAQQAGVCQPVLLEVNIAGEATKGGFGPAEVEGALPALNELTHIEVRGLMAIPPPAPDPELGRPHFRRLRELAGSLAQRKLSRIHMDELSMGMSQDYEIAVEEGATFVRIGTAIFGARGA